MHVNAIIRRGGGALSAEWHWRVQKSFFGFELFQAQSWIQHDLFCSQQCSIVSSRTEWDYAHTNLTPIVNSVETMHKNHPLPSLRKFVEVKKKFRILNSEGTAGKWRADGCVLALRTRRQSSEIVGSWYFFQFIILNFSNLFASHLLISLRSDDDCDVKLEATRNNNKELFRQKNVSPFSVYSFNFNCIECFSKRSDIFISDLAEFGCGFSAAFYSASTTLQTRVCEFQSPPWFRIYLWLLFLVHAEALDVFVWDVFEWHTPVQPLSLEPPLASCK